MKAARFFFQSRWEIAATPETVWHFLATPPFQWDRWWTQLQDLHIIEQPSGLRGTVFSCYWQSPLGYRLFTKVRISEVDEQKRVRFEASGSLRGVVECRLQAVNGKATRVDIDWRVQTTKTWMKLASPLLRPLFIWAHHQVMRSGERALQQHLDGKQKDPG